MSEKELWQSVPELENVVEEDITEKKYLILHNDEVHSFDYVIETLVDICALDAIQAEQCAFIVHYKGKCDVKKGSSSFLKPLKDALIEKGLGVTIE